MEDNENNNELEVNQLDDVSGGVSPYFPTSNRHLPKLKPNQILKSMQNSLPKSNEVIIEKPFEICPICGSDEVSFNSVENICMCTKCGYCEDRSK